METPTQDAPEVLETSAPEAEPVEPEAEPAITQEEIAELKEKAALVDELESKNKQLFERQKKLEKEQKEAAKTNPSGLSSGDLLAVTNAKIHEDDIERVERFAKSEGLSIKEALKSEELKAMLDLRADQRRTADATNIGNVRRGSVQIPDEVLISNASLGKLPESDYEIERLIAAKARESKG